MQANLLDRLKQFFGAFEETSGREDNDHASGETSERAANRVDEFIDRAERKQSTSVMAGCVQVLGLDAIKARLGSRWNEVSDRALGVVEDVLSLHLEPGDVYRPVGDAAVQICFDTSNEDDARHRIEQISAIVLDRLLTELADSERELSVRSFVAPVPIARARTAEGATMGLYNSLIELQREAEAREARQQGVMALRSAGAVFQPLWSNQDFGVTKNRCVLEFVAGAAAAKHLSGISDLGEMLDAVAALDSVLFTRSLEGLHRALAEIKNATIVIPVHYHTLASGHEEFVELALTLPQPYKRFVLLELIGIPASATESELLRAVQTGRSIAERLILHISPTDYRLADHIRKLVWGLSLSVAEIHVEDPVIRRDLNRFAVTCADLGLYSFAYGASTLGRASAVAAAGFDYVGGTAVHNTVPLPRSHGRFKPIFGGENAARQPVGELDNGRRQHQRFAPLDPNSTITMSDGQRYPCRILNFSVSGAALSANVTVEVGAEMIVGAIPAQVVRLGQNSFGVRFMELQELASVEHALRASAEGPSWLERLKALSAH